MLDTIKLTLDKNMFWIKEISLFQKQTQNATRGYFTLVQNPTKTELKQGIYKPRLTLTHRFNCSGRSEKTLAIEFSTPKLIYGNNFDELTDCDFPDVIQKLKVILKEMGVCVFENNLINAPVSSVHYSKNIILTDHTLPYTYLNQLSKLNINKRLDTDRTSFRNEGHSFKCHANSFEIAFYDKIKDLQQAKISEKRAEEKDNAIQLNLLDSLRQQKPLEVIRIEIRLNKRQKIKQVLKTIEKEAELNFATLFNQNLAKQVLLHHLLQLEEAYPPLLMYKQDTPAKFFTGLLVANPKIKLMPAIKMVGLRELLDEVGVRGFRELTKKYKNSSWYSLNKEMKKLKKANDVNVFSTLRKELTEFKPTKLLDFQDKMLNNDKYD